MNLDLEPYSRDIERILDAILVVDNEFLGNDMDDFAFIGKADRLGRPRFRAGKCAAVALRCSFRCRGFPWSGSHRERASHGSI